MGFGIEARKVLTRPWDRIQFVAGDFGLRREEGSIAAALCNPTSNEATSKSAATLRAKAVLSWGFVARSVEDRAGYTPSLAPRPRAKRLLANCVLSHGLVSRRSSLAPSSAAKIATANAIIPRIHNAVGWGTPQRGRAASMIASLGLVVAIFFGGVIYLITQKR